jgi:hypothetical protein
VIAKFWIWFWKKLHNPTKEQIDLTSAGALASLIAFSLASPGLMPCGVRVTLSRTLVGHRKGICPGLFSNDAGATSLTLVLVLQGGCQFVLACWRSRLECFAAVKALVPSASGSLLSIPIVPWVM